MDAARDVVDGEVAEWGRVVPGVDAGPVEVFGRVMRVCRGVEELLERAYLPFGVSRGEFDVLAALRRAGEPYTLSPRRLSDALMVTTGGMTGRLDKLEHAGLVRRSPDPHDRRALEVSLTERGLDIADQALVAGLQVQGEALAGFDAAELAQLGGLLRRLLAGVGGN
ncbi:MarR family transcriptional regulator [Streptomyces sp. J2-1]|uniref:MarR family winged helix-turn-helix transcriptional regulator n=1 Tax=Streptomyces corallincola TaxID=2851888 RepID=UPI001C394191|nr:MarR family transcriptional regulator [Streptomyces corallincola]MBV2356520.1 MarR family transcriptional regulator [Streptomyces corallincola]